MEVAVRQAKARLSELIAAAQAGERVIITKNGQPAVEIVRVRRGGGIDFKKLEAARASGSSPTARVGRRNSTTLSFLAAFSAPTDGPRDANFS